MADNKPTFHHMNNSQSQRIFWLLEELAIPFNLVLHTRNPPTDPKRPFLSPDTLLSTGPYGKAPLLITGAADGNRYIPESSAIATYLIRTFDDKDKFGLKNGDWIRDEVLCSLMATDLARSTFTGIMMDLHMLGRGDGPRGGFFDGPSLRLALANLERELKEGPPGGWFMGKHPGRADIMLEFPITSCKHRKYVDLEKEFPALNEWLERVYARDAWKRALGKAFDGVYDMSVFPMRPRM